ncbi:FSH1-domain-containing protein [Thelephora terrestris]|uniref:FSH1-domain-containing protein n=1 Tax=Thelephora terrestris TaxID=56493 RepID=A0A9P6HR56_9AGAM|nr:FSH1-domain-containing protein [Thelephora terrestris]
MTSLLDAPSVLMLHGYAQNAKIFSKRTAALRKTCAPEIELVYLDGPHILQPADLAFGNPLVEPALEETGEAVADPEVAPRGWGFKATPENAEPGLVEALEVIKDALSKDTYAGVFGFSQGGGMAATVAALLEKPHLYPPFIVNGKPIHPPLEFCVSVAGYRPSGPIRTPLFVPSYSTPTLHVLGRTDVVVVEERSNQLIEVSANRWVEYHPGGHFVPSQKHWRDLFRTWMLDQKAEIPSPSIN